MQRTAEALRGAHLAGSVLRIPPTPVIPPAAGMFARAREPRFGISWQRRVEEVSGLRICRWIHDALDVPARGEHEVDFAAQDVPRLITRLPGRDVIRDARHDVGRYIH